MEKKRKISGGGIIFYLIIIAVVLVVIFAIRQSTSNNVNYTKEEFLTDLSEGDIKAVEFIRNKEIPTGKIRVEFTDKDIKKKVAYISDTSEIENLIIAYNESNANDDTDVT